MSQLNKIQIKAEILSVVSKLQTNLDSEQVDSLLVTLSQQEDKEFILETLTKELAKSTEQRGISVCFLMLKLSEEKAVEAKLWNTLKNPQVEDALKAIILNVLKEMGNKVDYEKIEECFENPKDVIDADTKKLLHVAIVNPEAQIDFLDFLVSLSDFDKKVLVKSLGEDYSSDDLANILNPLFLYSPNTEIGKVALEVLGETKSQLALHALLEALDFVEDEETISAVKKNISKLKIAGVREDNALDFYKKVLSTKPYCSYSSYPDGHGNQAVIFSRERDDETIQMMAVVINDVVGIVDCFGFNQISKSEFERIVSKFYGNDEKIYINPHVAKVLFAKAEKLTRKLGGKISYEFICWKMLLADVEPDAVPYELTLKSAIELKPLGENDFAKIALMDFVQRWFLDTEYSETFKKLVDSMNSKILGDTFDYNFEEIVEESCENIFDAEEKTLLDKRILMSAYLKYLAAENEDAQILYSLYFDDEHKRELEKNIIRKSIYEYYMSQKFKYKDEHKMTNIFAMRNNQRSVLLSLKQIEHVISQIEKCWVKN